MTERLQSTKRFVFYQKLTVDNVQQVCNFNNTIVTNLQNVLTLTVVSTQLGGGFGKPHGDSVPMETVHVTTEMRRIYNVHW
jgi:hypothetical protein